MTVTSRNMLHQCYTWMLVVLTETYCNKVNNRKTNVLYACHFLCWQHILQTCRRSCHKTQALHKFLCETVLLVLLRKCMKNYKLCEGRSFIKRRCHFLRLRVVVDRCMVKCGALVEWYGQWRSYERGKPSPSAALPKTNSMWPALESKKGPRLQYEAYAHNARNIHICEGYGSIALYIPWLNTNCR